MIYYEEGPVAKSTESDVLLKIFNAKRLFNRKREELHDCTATLCSISSHLLIPTVENST